MMDEVRKKIGLFMLSERPLKIVKEKDEYIFYLTDSPNGDVTIGRMKKETFKMKSVHEILKQLGVAKDE